MTVIARIATTQSHLKNEAESPCLKVATRRPLRPARRPTPATTLGERILATGSLPFGGGDSSVGMEYELQVAVEGSQEHVDLPLAIRDSSFYRNTEKRAARGDLPAAAVTALAGYLDHNHENIWENSWVRIEQRHLGRMARELLATDFLADKRDANGPCRRDLNRFHCNHNGTNHLRIPISYLLKLSLSQALDESPELPAPLLHTCRRLLAHFQSDNTSPELLSFTVPTSRSGRIGELAARETARTFLFSQLLTQFANTRFGLLASGQRCLVYNAPHAPCRQKKLNELVPDSFYRHLFMSPCLSGWDRGEEKHEYMMLCHKTLSRSQLNAISKLKDAGIITNNLVILPNTSNTCLANNGTHVSLGSNLLTRLAADPASGLTAAAEKHFGDLVIKIVEHFLPLFVTTYTAAPYRLDFADFHPEKVLGFLPHELDYTHLRMIWRRWKKKADISFMGRALTPFGPRGLDRLLAGALGLHGDLIPDFRLVDYLVTLLSTDTCPALDGRPGNQEQLVHELSEMGVFDSRMSIYLPYRLRQFSRMGYSGFEGRGYSLFPSLLGDMAEAVDLQNLITALAYRYVLRGTISHRDIPDNPSIESERRQIFFGSAIGIPTFYVRVDSGNRFLHTLLERVRNQRHSRRYKQYIRVPTIEFQLALVDLLERDAADLIEELDLKQTIDSLRRRLLDTCHRASDRLIQATRAQLHDRRSPKKIASETFNAAAERYYRTDLRKLHLREGLVVLEEDCRRLERLDAPLLRSLMQGNQPTGSVADYVGKIGREVVEETVSADDLRRLITLVVAVIHHEPAGA